MDSKSREYLDKILAKTIAELTREEKAFLRARRSYLRKSQLEEYADILNQTSEKETVKKKNAKEEN